MASSLRAANISSKASAWPASSAPLTLTTKEVVGFRNRAFGRASPRGLMWPQSERGCITWLCLLTASQKSGGGRLEVKMSKSDH